MNELKGIKMNFNNSLKLKTKPNKHKYSFINEWTQMNESKLQ